MKIGVIIADDNEYAPVLDFAKKNNCEIKTRRGNESVRFDYSGKSVIAVKCGIGKVNSASAAAFLIADDNVEVIINPGLSGAVSGLKKGDIAAGKSYTECDFDLTALGYNLGEKPRGESVIKADRDLLDKALSIKNVKPASCGTGDVFLADKDKKEFYKNLFNINEFDMETGAIASVCRKCQIPYLALRQISDTADDCAAESYKNENENLTEETPLFDALIKLIEIV